MTRSVLLFSWDYSPDCTVDEYFKLAHAFAESSVLLFEGMSAGRAPATFHHAKAAATLFEHGLELFLKAALGLVGHPIPRTHKMEQMLGTYRKRYPDKAYAFTGTIDDAVRDSAARPAGQFLRYPEDRNGVPWPGHVHFDLGIWLGETRRFRDDYRRLEPLLRERPSGPPAERTCE